MRARDGGPAREFRSRLTYTGDKIDATSLGTVPDATHAGRAQGVRGLCPGDRQQMNSPEILSTGPPSRANGWQPRDAAIACERATAIPPGRQTSLPIERDRFVGWGVMGLSFDSGHVLGLRRFPVSSIGPGYTSVWHRSPHGEWSFWSTVPAELSCARYTGTENVDSGETAIELAWKASDHLTVTVEAHELSWEIRLGSTPLIRSLGAILRWLPERVSVSDLPILGATARPLPGIGRLALNGRMPGGQIFHLMPSRLWLVTASRATLRGDDLGSPAALAEQARLGDFHIPQRGLLAVATVDFETEASR